MKKIRKSTNDVGSHRKTQEEPTCDSSQQEEIKIQKAMQSRKKRKTRALTSRQCCTGSNEQMARNAAHEETAIRVSTQLGKQVKRRSVLTLRRVEHASPGGAQQSIQILRGKRNPSGDQAARHARPAFHASPG